MTAFDSDLVSLRIVDTGEEIRIAESYEFKSEFLTPSDGWTVVVGEEVATQALLAKLRPGTKVQFVVNDNVQTTGFVDGAEVDYTGGGSGGVKARIHGRDAMAPLVDAHVDPLFVFSEGLTLGDVFAKLCTPYGFTTFATTDADRSIVTGSSKKSTAKVSAAGGLAIDYAKTYTSPTATTQASTTIPTTYVEYDPTAPKYLKSFPVTQAKPHHGEGVFSYLSRLSKRFKLWPWAGPLGDKVIVAASDFTQPASYSVTTRLGAASYLSAKLSVDRKDQPDVIVATGYGGGGAWSKTKLKVAAVNELTAVDSGGVIHADVQAILTQHPGCKVLPVRKELIDYGANWKSRNVIPLFVEDNEAKTIGQLEGFVQNTLAQLQARAMTLHMRFPGHSRNGRVWAVNTICDVDDDVLDVHGRWWVREVTHSRSRAGTFTDVVMIPSGLMEIG